MKNNGFVMIDKNAARLLPKDRVFTPTEALLSLEIDRNNGQEWSYKGYAVLWSWPFSKVRRFIIALGSEKGLIRVGSGQGRFEEPVRLIEQNAPDKRIENGSKTDTRKPIKTGVDEDKRIENGSKTDTTIRLETKDNKTICPEQCSEPVVEAIKIPLKGGSFFEVTSDHIRQLQETFPGIDVVQEIRSCRQWNTDNPDRRKTIKGIRRHISGWINRQHEKRTPSLAPQIDCQICFYNQDPGEPCRNIGKPGYPAKCQSFKPLMN